MRFSLMAPFVLALAACAAPDPQPVTVAAADPSEMHVECHQESSLGSTVIHKVCTRTPSAAEMNQQNDQLLHQLPNAYLAHPAVGSGLKPVSQ